MFGFGSKKNMPLHDAIINNSPKDLKCHCENVEAFFQKDALGFTAMELAKLLDAKECLGILWEKIPLEYSESEKKNLGIDYLPFLKFQSYVDLEGTIKQCPLLMSHSFWGAVNKEWGEQYFRKIWSAYVANVEVKWVNKKMGYGVYAKENFALEEYIGEYTGLIKKKSRQNKKLNPYCFHYPTKYWSWDYHFIDAKDEGNEMRYLNHSDEPNLEPRCLLDRGLLHVFFVVTKDINKGEQLMFNYGSDYWKNRVKF